MLIPKFSIKHLLIAMTILAAVSLLVKFAIDGHAWAMAIAVALAGIVLTFTLHGLAFVVASPTILIDAALRMQQRPTTPFATAEPPPQILPPQDPE